MLEGFGWKTLPGLYPTGKVVELDVSYKVSLLHALATSTLHDMLSNACCQAVQCAVLLNNIYTSFLKRCDMLGSKVTQRC